MIRKQIGSTYNDILMYRYFSFVTFLLIVFRVIFGLCVNKEPTDHWGDTDAAFLHCFIWKGDQQFVFRLCWFYDVVQVEDKLFFKTDAIFGVI